MRKTQTKLTKLLYSCLDIFLIHLGFVLAYLFKFGSFPDRNFEPYLAIAPVLSIIALIVFYMFDLYSDWRRKSVHNLIYSIILSILIIMVTTMAITFWFRGFAFPRSVIFIAAFLQIILVSGVRSLFWGLSKRINGKKLVLIIGKDKVSEKILTEKTMATGWFIVKGFLEIGKIKNINTKVRNVDAVLLSHELSEKEKGEIMSYCSYCRVEVLVIPELYELFILDAEQQQIDDMLVLSVSPPILGSSELFLKRALDIVASVLMLFLLSPIMLALYIWIPLSSSGPAIFKQERIGKDERPYFILKFRSMINDAEKSTGPVLATEKDPRITRFGYFLRSTRLDEIPQLLNVLKGDMSLVGPRPERDFFIKQFDSRMPNYKYRMTVKPGITGLAQVMAKYETTVEDKLRFDLMYIKNYSFALDIKILFQTIRVMIQRGQANGVKVVTNKKMEDARGLSKYKVAEVKK